jgi:YYY domain-containing protein
VVTKLLYTSLFPVILSCSSLFIGRDAVHVAIWWLSLSAAGLAVLPLTLKVFDPFFDKGYIYSKIVGLVIPTYLLWLFSSLKILPFSSTLVYSSLLIVFSASYIILKGYRTVISLVTGDPDTLRIIIFQEALFLLFLLFFAFVKGQNPGSGVEMPMDYALLNTLQNSTYMPPVDMWYAGKPVNYYYYGQYLFAFLSKFSGIPTNITYNLGMATLSALGFLLAFSLAANLVHLYGNMKRSLAIIAGVVSASLLVFGGNLHTLIYAVILPAAKITGIYHGDVKPYFYADPRSFIGNFPPTDDKTITEFPAYSLALGDLHAQIIDIIFVITFVAILLVSMFRAIGTPTIHPENDRWYKLRNEHILLILFLAIIAMTNAWDFPIYATVAGVVILYTGLFHHGCSLKALRTALIDWIRLPLLSLLLITPFLVNFSNPTSGVYFTRILHLFSPLYIYQLSVVWGYQLFIVALFFVYIFKTEPHFTGANLADGIHGSKLANIIKNLKISDAFVLIICICAAGLVLIPEIIYQKDVNRVDFYRANTTWKVVLQAFILFDIAIGYIIVRIFTVKRSKYRQLILAVTISLLLGSALLFPIWGIGQPYNNLKKYRGLDLEIALKEKYSDDLQAANWLKRNVEGQPVVLEAYGDSYSNYNRISICTGYPTILGWYSHEWTWRGSKSVAQLEQRVNDVKAIYESDDIVNTRKLLDKYSVKYVVAGKYEREKFSGLNEKKLDQLGDAIYNGNSIKIYDITK